MVLLFLSRREILAEVKKGALKITPFEEKNVGECSIDLRLGKEFRLFQKQGKPVEISERPFLWEKQTKSVELEENGLLVTKPNQLILGITMEKIKMPPYLCGFIEGRSRLARMGLLVHVSSSLVQPGVENRQVLEIANLSPSKIALKPGLKICQLLLAQLTSPEKHKGIFARQEKI